MSQKEFAQRTGIAESSISDWKKKRTNPVSDKILIICEVLGVTPYELLSGAEHTGTRSKTNEMYVFTKDTELGMLIETYQAIKRRTAEKITGVYGCTEGLNFLRKNTHKRINYETRGMKKSEEKKKRMVSRSNLSFNGKRNPQTGDF